MEYFRNSVRQLNHFSTIREFRRIPDAFRTLARQCEQVNTIKDELILSRQMFNGQEEDYVNMEWDQYVEYMLFVASLNNHQSAQWERIIDVNWKNENLHIVAVVHKNGNDRTSWMEGNLNDYEFLVQHFTNCRCTAVWINFNIVQTFNILKMDLWQFAQEMFNTNSTSFGHTLMTDRQIENRGDLREIIRQRRTNLHPPGSFHNPIVIDDDEEDDIEIIEINRRLEYLHNDDEVTIEYGYDVVEETGPSRKRRRTRSRSLSP